MNYLKTHESVRRIKQHGVLHSCEPMRTVYGSGHPIRPVNKVFENANSKRMRSVQLGELNMVLSIPITRLDDI